MRLSSPLRPIHPFPARMAASIALKQLSGRRKILRVLDPLVGSGTSLVVAKSYGHDVVGFDIDPMAVLLARSWLTGVSESGVRLATVRTLRCARLCVARLRLREAYPCPARDVETRRFIRYWFDPVNRLQLTALSRAIERERNRKIRTLLWCAFSKLIIAKQAGASLAMDLAHSRPHRVRDRSPFRPLRRFTEAVESVLRLLPFKNGVSKSRASVRRSDARDLPLPAESVDLVITSPPYMDAIDYLRCHKFSLVWMGYSIWDLRVRRARGIGAGRGSMSSFDHEVNSIVRRMVGGKHLNDRHERVLCRYVADMREVIQEIRRVLVPRGKATFVIGNSTQRGVRIRNSLGVLLLDERCGLRQISRRTRVLPDNRRYLPPPSVGRNHIRRRIRTEVVLTFRKVA